MVLYLARHADADPSAGEHADAGLSPAGIEQARRLGRRLAGAGLSMIHHGRARRAADTARWVAELLPGVPVEASDLLRDRTPVPRPGSEQDYPDWFASWSAGVPEGERDPGGEAVSAAVEHFSRPAGAPRLVVTHAFVIAWFVRHALDAPAASWLRLSPANAGLTVIDYPPDRPPRLLAVNDTGHLLAPS